MKTNNYTIGYIDHSTEVHNSHLGPSLLMLTQSFDVLKTDSKLCPAVNYNNMIGHCKTPYLILTHQDVTFSPDLLDRIDETIKRVPDFGALGMVGVDNNRSYKWSRCDTIAELDTLDCCFIVLRPDIGARFDEKTFSGLHQYVEDYCGQINRVYGRKVYTILTHAVGLYPGETHSKKIEGNSFLAHHGATFAKRGPCWGDWRMYNQKLQVKWPGIKVT